MSREVESRALLVRQAEPPGDLADGGPRVVREVCAGPDHAVRAAPQSARVLSGVVAFHPAAAAGDTSRTTCGQANQCAVTMGKRVSLP